MNKYIDGNESQQTISQSPSFLFRICHSEKRVQQGSHHSLQKNDQEGLIRLVDQDISERQGHAARFPSNSLVLLNRRNQEVYGLLLVPSRF